MYVRTNPNYIYTCMYMYIYKRFELGAQMHFNVAKLLALTIINILTNINLTITFIFL